MFGRSARLLTLPWLLALAACGSDREAAPEIAAQPVLWEVANDAGTTEGWLFGTIHALPDGVSWRTPLLEDTIERADLLVVEVAGLDDGSELTDIFVSLAFDSPPGPLADRIDPALRPQYEVLLTKAKVRSDHFDAMESWAAALTLAQVVQTAKSANGVDRALLRDFEGREIVEIEGGERQLGIFDALPEGEQRDLLDAVIAETRDYDDDMGRLARIWSEGDTDELAKLTREGILADPELYEALLAGRNRAWTAQLENLFSTDSKPLVAVGAGHMFGPDGLPAMLEARGYTVRRIQ
ncbi:MAG: TraB/GumN family protein [Erythrobacter sp.]|nr:TraB/GumN family protein [Erythrobacter sp.]